MEKLGVGIVGFGRIGAEHARWIAACENARPVAVADATPARQALAAGEGLRVHPSLVDLLADPQVDAVLIATPTAMHAEHATLALSAGKAVMVEKPMALDLPQSRKLVELAEQRRLTLSVFHNRRWDPDFLTLQKAISSGVFGKIINVESRLGQWASCVGPAAKEYRPGWQNEASFGGGGLYDWGSHFVDQVWRLLLPAKPIRVFAQLRGNVWTRECDDLARMLIDFDDGVAVLVEINTTTAAPLPRWHIDGTRGSATSPHSPAFDTQAWATFAWMPATPQPGEPARLARAEAGLSEPAIWQAFAVACQGKGRPAVSWKSVLPTMALLDAARTSAREGRAVLLEDLPDWID